MLLGAGKVDRVPEEEPIVQMPWVAQCPICKSFYSTRSCENCPKCKFIAEAEIKRQKSAEWWAQERKFKAKQDAKSNSGQLGRIQ